MAEQDLNKIIFITGGVRSGKSDFAVKLAKQSGRSVAFVATCAPRDNEMARRVKKHKKNRPKDWQTIEEEFDLPGVIRRLKSHDAAIIDCLTLWISNLLLSGLDEKKIIACVKRLAGELKKTKACVIMVSNEVGWGIVPENYLGRVFRDIVGTAHRRLAKISDEVYLMAAGLPLRVK